MYITEISYADFLKLGLVGYKQALVRASEHTRRLENIAVSPIISEEDIEYSKRFEHKSIAVFINLCSEDEADDNIVWDKFYVRTPATYCVWCGVEHIYSEKGRWLIKADSEDGAISKRAFNKIYLVHLED